MDYKRTEEVDDVALIKASGDGLVVASSPVKEDGDLVKVSQVKFDEVASSSQTKIALKIDSAESDQELGLGQSHVDSLERDNDDCTENTEKTRGDGSVNIKEAHLKFREQGSGADNDIKHFSAVETETQTKTSCDKEGHICFDCFPIPDALLEQVRRQTGMSKLMCLQTIQTVVKFYKQDLVCSKYFAYETSDDGFSDYSHTEAQKNIDDSEVLFRATPTPLRCQREHELQEISKPKPIQTTMKSKAFTLVDELSSEPEMEFAPISMKPSLKLCGADKFRNLVRRLKLDSTSRSWKDPKNVSFVFTFFRKLNKLVAALDKSVLKRLIVEDDFEFMWAVANLLRKENRWSIQWEILGILGNVAARDSRSRKYLLDSEFPIYLSRVIMNPDTEPPRLSAYAELLTVLFTGGKSLPIHLIEHFGFKFVMLVLDIIENDDTRPGWSIPDVLIKLLLAYNLQFNQNDIYNNITILAISRSGQCQTLASRLIDWLDQIDAPLTNAWEVSVSVHQCVIKIIMDIFLCRTTSHVFSVAQSVMLMSVLTKSLSNFRIGDKRRTSYLKLIQTILRHCKYDYIRNTPCVDNLEEILCEKSQLSLQDQQLIRNIFKEFPQLHQERF